MKFDLGRDLYEACEENSLVRAREALAASLPSCLHGSREAGLHCIWQPPSVLLSLSNAYWLLEQT
jgi:hypothetical protein